ncbi:MAG: very short patch repair endonuclease [Acidimicrobiales bacterium]
MTQHPNWLRRVLHRQELRYYVHRLPLPEAVRREADIVLLNARAAVFVDGCFWHGCPENGTSVHRTNGWYWSENIQRNKERDLDTDERLKCAGWTPIRI